MSRPFPNESVPADASKPAYCREADIRQASKAGSEDVGAVGVMTEATEMTPLWFVLDAVFPYPGRTSSWNGSLSFECP